MTKTLDIIDIPELVGRTIVAASRWSDNTSMSIVLDNGGILQISPVDADYEPIIHWEIEFAPSIIEDDGEDDVQALEHERQLKTGLVFEEGHDPRYNMSHEDKQAIAKVLWPAGSNTEGD